MSDNLDEFLGGKVADEAPIESVEAEPIVAEPIAVEPAPEPEIEHDEHLPDPVPGTRQVPLSALEAERKQRQDWKEQFARADERAKALEKQIAELQAAPRQPQAATHQPEPQQRYLPNPAEDPEGYARGVREEIQQTLFNERLNVSEAAYKQANPDADTKAIAEKFMAAAKADARLAAQLRMQPHPYAFAAEHLKRAEALEQIGDPLSYREKLEAEIRAKIAAETSATTPSAPATRAVPHLPASLATVRSASPRGVAPVDGSPSFESLFPTR